MLFFIMKRLILYAGVALGLAGCAPLIADRVKLTAGEQSRLEILSNFNNRYFQEGAQACLTSSSVEVLKYHFRFLGSYTPMDKKRGVDEGPFRGKYGMCVGVEDILMHESVHQQIACGNLSVSKFMGLYDKMDSDKFAIKQRVEERISTYSWPFGYMNEERLAYFVEFWMMGKKFKIPQDMEKFLSPVLKAQERKSIIRGLIGTSTRAPLKKKSPQQIEGVKGIRID